MKIALGTAQFGLDYGVTNNQGQVSIKEVKKILDEAKRCGIYTLDTASCYGNSEKKLGAIGLEGCQIITKTMQLKNSIDEVIDGFYLSLANLKVDSVKALLIHNIDDLKDKRFDYLYRKLIALKKQGLISQIGFSTYKPESVDFLLKNFDFDIIQLPLNVFDTRLIDGGQLKLLKKRGVEIHARSIFLQGVLLDLSNLPDYFLTWKSQFDVYQSIVSTRGVSLLEYALNFVLNIPEIDIAVVGVTSKNNLIDIMKASRLNGIYDSFFINDANLINPTLWSQK
jgi:aryl-alcohol dehydrogenase-like predicted oxidoreductase